MTNSSPYPPRTSSQLSQGSELGAFGGKGGGGGADPAGGGGGAEASGTALTGAGAVEGGGVDASTGTAATMVCCGFGASWMM